MNGRNDYFGRTVNMAARIQALGEPGEIVLEAGLYSTLSVQRPEPSAWSGSQPFVAALKGVVRIPSAKASVQA